MKDFQKAIIEFINLTGYTQRQISANAGIAPEQLSDWKNGRRSISLENFIHLCKSNGINPDLPLSNIAQSESLENCEKECLKSKCNKQK